MKKVIASLAALAAAIFANAQDDNPRFIPVKYDADTGVSTGKMYTHAVNLGGNQAFYDLNGVLFTNVFASNGATTGNGECVGTDGATYGWSGFPTEIYSGSQHGTLQFIASDPSSTLYLMMDHIAANWSPNDASAYKGTLRLTNLTVGAWYEFSLFIRAWDHQQRQQSLTFWPGADPSEQIFFEYDQNRDMLEAGVPTVDRLLVFRYQARDDGTGKGELAVYCDTPANSWNESICIPAFMNEALSAPFKVEGALPGMDADVANPAFGLHPDIAPGSNFTATVAAAWTNNPANPTSIAYAAGWETFADNGHFVFTNAASGAGATLANYELPGIPALLRWKFAVTNKLEVSAGTGGTVSTNGAWLGSGDVLEVRATPSANYAFYKWTGDVPLESAFLNPLPLDAEKPRVVKAQFTGVQHVAEDGNDENDGSSFDPADAKATIAKAVEACGPNGGLVLVASGDYYVDAQIVITNALTVRGDSGDPQDVHVRRDLQANGYHRIFRLDHPDARLEFLTVRDGRNSINEGGYVSGGNIFIGPAGGTVADCIVTNGSAQYTEGGQGGNIAMVGAAGRVLRCKILDGTAGQQAGGIYMSAGRVEQCLFMGNGGSSAATVRINGGGVLANCTIVRNYSWTSGGAVQVNHDAGAVYNCVIVDNTTTSNPDDSGGSTFDGGRTHRYFNCVSDSLYLTGNNNISATGGFGFADAKNLDYHLSPAALAVGAGDATLAALESDLDLDRMPVALSGTVDAGCYQLDLGKIDVYFDPGHVEAITPADILFTATVTGTNGAPRLFYTWDFGNETGAEGEGLSSVPATYARGGFHTVTLTVTNLTDGGASVSRMVSNCVHTAPPVLYVDRSSATPSEPYDSAAWTNAAADIQTAVDYAVNGCLIIVRESDGEYVAVGNQSNSGLNITKAIRVRSENDDPAGVVLRAIPYSPQYHSARALRVSNPGAWVSGLTLTGGRSDAGAQGKGVLIELGGVVSNCVIRGNGADGNSTGAGAYLHSAEALLTHCVITNNTTDNQSGAVVYMAGGRVENCLVAGNFMDNGETAVTCVFDMRGGVVRNCTIAGNGQSGPGVVYFQEQWGGAVAGVMENCVIAGNLGPLCIGNANATNAFVNCTTDGGVAFNETSNFGTADAIFKNFGAGDYRLKTGSPALNRGPRVDSGAVATAGIDLDGNPRIYGERMDNGCYELQHAGGTLLMVR